MTLHFFRNRREAFRHARSVEDRAVVAAVHIPGNRGKLSDLYLTDAEKMKRDKVSRTLASGGNPFTPEKDATTKDIGGLAKDRKARADERLAVADMVSDRRFAAMEAKWTAERQTGHVYVNVDLRTEFRRPAPAPDDTPKITTPDGRVIRDPDMFQCSFCGTWLHRSKVTTGRGDPQLMRKLEIEVIDDVETVTEKVIWFNRKVIACADCILMIRPTVHKDGSLTNNIDFPERD